MSTSAKDERKVSFALTYLKKIARLLGAEPHRSVHHIRTCLHYYSKWRSSLQSSGDSIANEQPWITFECADFLRKKLSRDAIVFEYGSGGSSVFFSRLAAKVISIEHDRLWHGKVVQALREKGVANCDCRFQPPSEATIVKEEDAQDPNGFAGTGYPGFSFKDYVLTILDYPVEFFDIVVVDGRARNACVLYSRDRIRPGGFLLLDNSDRDKYAPSRKLMNGWKPTIFKGPCPYLYDFTQTTVWQKTHQD